MINNRIFIVGLDDFNFDILTSLGVKVLLENKFCVNYVNLNKKFGEEKFNSQIKAYGYITGLKKIFLNKEVNNLNFVILASLWNLKLYFFCLIFKIFKKNTVIIFIDQGLPFIWEVKNFKIKIKKLLSSFFYINVDKVFCQGKKTRNSSGFRIKSKTFFSLGGNINLQPFLKPNIEIKNFKNPKIIYVFLDQGWPFHPDNKPLIKQKLKNRYYNLKSLLEKLTFNTSFWWVKHPRAEYPQDFVVKAEKIFNSTNACMTYINSNYKNNVKHIFLLVWSNSLLSCIKQHNFTMLIDSRPIALESNIYLRQELLSKNYGVPFLNLKKKLNDEKNLKKVQDIDYIGFTSDFINCVNGEVNLDNLLLDFINSHEK